MKMKSLLKTIIVIVGISACGYYYYKGLQDVEKVSSEAQKSVTLIGAVNTIESLQKERPVNYKFTRQYDLTSETLWSIDFSEFGAKAQTKILEQHATNGIVINTEDLEKVESILKEKSIKYEIIKEVK